MFPDNYPYTNFHELNLGYFIIHFREIFSQWADLYDQMLDWKSDTDADLASWKTGVETELTQRETALRAELETWKAQTGQDIAGWENATLAALTAWQTATQAVFEAIRVEAAGSATAAAASATDAATAKTAAETAQAAAEAAAASVQASATQIATNTADITDLKTQLKNTENGLEQITDVTPINFIDGKYLYTGAQIGSTLDITDIRNFDGLSYAIVDVSPGDVISITGKGLNNAFLYTIIDSNNVILAKASLNEQLNDGIVVAPENADKIILNSETPLLGFCYIGLSLNRRFSYVDLTGKSGKTYKIIAGVIRNSGNGWQFIVDANHQGDLNCISVSSNNNGQIVLDYSGISATKVISVVVTPDETFAGLGYLCGGSVGRDKTYIEVYKYTPIGVHGAIDCASDGTITIRTGSEGITSAVWNSEYNTMTVTHDSVDPSDSVPVVIPWKYSKTLPRVASWSGSTVTLDFMQLTDGNKATSVTNELSFMIQRQSAMKLKLVKQDANNIINSNGNFWFIGIFQTS